MEYGLARRGGELKWVGWGYNRENAQDNKGGGSPISPLSSLHSTLSLRNMVGTFYHAIPKPANSHSNFGPVNIGGGGGRNCGGGGGEHQQKIMSGHYRPFPREGIINSISPELGFGRLWSLRLVAF